MTDIKLSPSVKPDSTSKMVKRYLGTLEPLTVLTLQDLYTAISVGSQDSIRAALYGCSLGSPVSATRKPRKYYAIKLNLSLSDSIHKEKDVFLSLPALPRELLEHDSSDKHANRIKADLGKKYSPEVVKYWMCSAQYRSVDLIRKNVNKAKSRDGNTCKLCKTVNVLRDEYGLSSLPETKKITGCHIISRRIVFWLAVAKISEHHDLFSANGVIALKKALMENEYHSSPRYMIALCSKHDSLLLGTLKKHTPVK